jgi:hypothetical protein
MPYEPSRRLDTVLTALLPPVSREHVLGDLAECADSRAHYIAGFVSVWPKVVFSELRRKLRTDSGLGLMAALAAATLAIAAGTTRGASLANPGEWLRWATPWATWMAGCTLAAAYGRAGTRLWNGWCLLAALLASLGVARLTGLPAGAVAGAIVVATALHIAMTLPRVAADFTRLATAGPRLSLDNVHEHARKFQRRIFWRNMRESGAAAFVLIANANNLLSGRLDSPAAWAAPVLGTCGLFYVMYAIHMKAGSRRIPDNLDARAMLHFHQQEITRQRDMLRLVPYWYLLPLVPGMLATALVKWHPVSTPLGLVVAAAVFYGIARLNVWGAKWLDGMLAEAQALEEPSSKP